MNPTKLLKVPPGAYKKANEMGILNEFLFYYSLKSINIEGCFPRGSIVLISEKVGVSIITVKRNLKKLEVLGWLVKNGTSRNLVSYDHVFKSLGYDLDSLKLFRVSTDNFRDNLFVKEIENNFKSQEAAIVNKHIAKIADTEKTSSTLNKTLRKNFNRSRELYWQIKNIRKERYLGKVNYDVTLSCAGLSRLFGYSSSMQGHLIQKHLEKIGLIQVKKRSSIYITNDIPLRGLKYLQSGGNCFWDGCYLERGKALKRQPNLISII